jgi:hypothetical protein
MARWMINSSLLDLISVSNHIMFGFENVGIFTIDGWPRVEEPQCDSIT